MPPVSTPITTWLSVGAIVISALGLLSRFRLDWVTASKAEVDSAAALAKQAIELLNTERDLSSQRSKDNQERLEELESARDRLNKLVAEQSIDIGKLKRTVSDCLEEKDKVLRDLMASNVTIETRRLKIVEMEARIAELESKGTTGGDR